MSSADRCGGSDVLPAKQSSGHGSECVGTYRSARTSSGRGKVRQHVSGEPMGGNSRSDCGSEGQQAHELRSCGCRFIQRAKSIKARLGGGQPVVLCPWRPPSVSAGSHCRRNEPSGCVSYPERHGAVSVPRFIQRPHPRAPGAIIGFPLLYMGGTRPPCGFIPWYFISSTSFLLSYLLPYLT